MITRLHQAQGEHYAGGAEAGLRDLLTPDVVWHVPGDNAIAGEHRGIEAVMAYFRHRRDLADCTFSMAPRELHVGEGDHVTALTDGAATINGARHTWTTIGLYRISGERIAECWLHWLDTHVGGYASLRAGGTDLVVVASSCEYHRGARLGDDLRIAVRPSAVGRTSISMEFSVRDDSGERLATGHTTYVSVSAEHGKIPLPEALRASPVTIVARLAQPEDHAVAVDVWRRSNTARGKAPGPERIARIRAKLADPAALVVVAEQAGQVRESSTACRRYAPRGWPRAGAWGRSASESGGAA